MKVLIKTSIISHIRFAGLHLLLSLKLSYPAHVHFLLQFSFFCVVVVIPFLADSSPSQPEHQVPLLFANFCPNKVFLDFHRNLIIFTSLLVVPTFKTPAAPDNPFLLFLEVKKTFVNGVKRTVRVNVHLLILFSDPVVEVLFHRLAIPTRFVC